MVSAGSSPPSWGWTKAHADQSGVGRPTQSPIMKQHHDNQNRPGDGPQCVPVDFFEFTHPTAFSICVAGTFNQRKPQAKARQISGRGRRLKQTGLTCGAKKYRLVMDVRWTPDPAARKSGPNPSGGSNSILRVAGSSGAPNFADADHSPLKT